MNFTINQWNHRNHHDHNVKMNSTHNKGKSDVAKRFVRTLENKIYKYKISVSKNMYIDKVDYTVNKCNNIYHSTIKVMLVYVNSIIYIDFNKENKTEDPKFEVGDHVRILTCKNISAKI